jgi:CubicO group peptidase (beta-lactamase class C family)
MIYFRLVKQLCRFAVSCDLFAQPLFFLIFPCLILKGLWPHRRKRKADVIYFNMGTNDKINSFLNHAVDKKVFSGAQVAWCSKGELLSNVAYAGFTNDEKHVEICHETLFDVASVTKLMTTAVALRLVERGEIALNAPIEKYLKPLAARSLGKATVSQLLTHRAGFVPWLPLFERIPREHRGTDFARMEITRLALKAGESTAPGTVVNYSDLGFIVLTHLLETMTGLKLDELIRLEVTVPLGLTNTRFNPPKACWGNVASTEDCPWRERVLTGEVHDDNAWSMGGVGGHAGLFATARDIARFGVAWLQARSNGGWISRDLAILATSRLSKDRGLGWDMKSHKESSAGTLMGGQSFGHLGFTGCSLWVDPDRSLVVALNTNRVHYGRNNLKIRQFRPEFHDLLVSALDG